VVESGDERFEWDLDKARTNLIRHQVSFEEAATVFSDPLLIVVPDVNHSHEEERFFAIGLSEAKRLLVVVHSEREHVIRLISARLATRRERTKYEEEPT
jgi:uncharacterized DUF497 family protein